MKVHALWAWTIHACFMRGLLGGNQSADKHRMVPPFFMIMITYTIKKIIKFFMPVCAFLLLCSSCDTFMQAMNGIAEIGNIPQNTNTEAMQVSSNTSQQTNNETYNYQEQQSSTSRSTVYKKRPKVKCTLCHGTGKCSTCAGRGTCKSCAGRGQKKHFNEWYDCSTCNGGGNCWNCRGTGRCRNCHGRG